MGKLVLGSGRERDMFWAGAHEAEKKSEIEEEEEEGERRIYQSNQSKWEQERIQQSSSRGGMNGGSIPCLVIRCVMPLLVSASLLSLLVSILLLNKSTTR